MQGEISQYSIQPQVRFSAWKYKVSLDAKYRFHVVFLLKQFEAVIFNTLYGQIWRQFITRSAAS